MAWHSVALDLPPLTTYHMKYSVLDLEILKSFHIWIDYES